MKTLTLVAAMVAASACATPGTRTAVGAGGGAATGAVVGGVLSGWKGAAVGGAIGAIAGGAAGNILDRQAAELKTKIAATKRTEDGILVDLKDNLLFTTGSDVLKPKAVEKVSALGDIVAKYPEDHIEIRGFTDSTGPVAFNEELSMRRAEAVRKVLIARGVKETQLMSIGMGPAQPVADNATPSGRAANRRVEVHIGLRNG